MGLVQRIVMAVGICALAVVLLASGFFVCLLPPVTHGVATIYADDPNSPFDRTQLVAVADATREYAFGSHNLDALYETIAAINEDYAVEIKAKNGTLGSDFPKLPDAASADGASADGAYLEQAIQQASEVYGFGANVISHLDDCFALVQGVYGFVLCSALVALACLVVVRILWGKRAFASMLVSASAAILSLFVLAALWGVADFSGLFTTFHTLFFVEGNWSFPAESLLICALPTGFWITMGIIWTLVSMVISLLTFILGFLLRAKAKR